VTVTTTMPIGDFSRATHLSVKMLRHYDGIGLLRPVEVDAGTGYRRYGAEQIVRAQIIRRFRDLDMPLDEIRAVLEATEIDDRNQVIANHLDRLETSLGRTQEAVSSLRDLLDHPQLGARVEHRVVSMTPAAVITEVIDSSDALTWYRGAIGELNATLEAQKINPTGPAGGVFATELFTEERGPATIFLPCEPLPRHFGRVSVTAIPPAELATMVHSGPFTNIDRTYGALANYVTQHALAVEGPMREYYLVGPSDTGDESLWRTEVGWPIFETRPHPEKGRL
jgi:DNA-binding transcriptional MerR regulator